MSTTPWRISSDRFNSLLDTLDFSKDPRWAIEEILANVTAGAFPSLEPQDIYTATKAYITRRPDLASNCSFQASLLPASLADLQLALLAAFRISSASVAFGWTRAAAPLEEMLGRVAAVSGTPAPATTEFYMALRPLTLKICDCLRLMLDFYKSVRDPGIDLSDTFVNELMDKLPVLRVLFELWAVTVAFGSEPRFSAQNVKTGSFVSAPILYGPVFNELTRTMAPVAQAANLYLPKQQLPQTESPTSTTTTTPLHSYHSQFPQISIPPSEFKHNFAQPQPLKQQPLSESTPFVVDSPSPPPADLSGTTVLSTENHKEKISLSIKQEMHEANQSQIYLPPALPIPSESTPMNPETFIKNEIHSPKSKRIDQRANSTEKDVQDVSLISEQVLEPLEPAPEPAIEIIDEIVNEIAAETAQISATHLTGELGGQKFNHNDSSKKLQDSTIVNEMKIKHEDFHCNMPLEKESDIIDLTSEPEHEDPAPMTSKTSQPNLQLTKLSSENSAKHVQSEHTNKDKILKSLDTPILKNDTLQSATKPQPNNHTPSNTSTSPIKKYKIPSHNVLPISKLKNFTFLKDLLTQISQSQKKYGFNVDDNSIAVNKNEHIYISPENLALKEKLLSTLDNHFKTHGNFQELSKKASSYFSWPGITDDIKDHMSFCRNCQARKIYPRTYFCKEKVEKLIYYPFSQPHIFNVTFDASGANICLLIVCRYTQYAKCLEFAANSSFEKITTLLSQVFNSHEKNTFPVQLSWDKSITNFQDKKFATWLDDSFIKVIKPELFHPAVSSSIVERRDVFIRKLKGQSHKTFPSLFNITKSGINDAAEELNSIRCRNMYLTPKALLHAYAADADTISKKPAFELKRHLGKVFFSDSRADDALVTQQKYAVPAEFSVGSMIFVLAQASTLILHNSVNNSKLINTIINQVSPPIFARALGPFKINRVFRSIFGCWYEIGLPTYLWKQLGSKIIIESKNAIACSSETFKDYGFKVSSENPQVFLKNQNFNIMSIEKLHVTPWFKVNLDDSRSLLINLTLTSQFLHFPENTFVIEKDFTGSMDTNNGNEKEFQNIESEFWDRMKNPSQIPTGPKLHNESPGALLASRIGPQNNLDDLCTCSTSGSDSPVSYATCLVHDFIPQRVLRSKRKYPTLSSEPGYKRPRSYNS